MSTKEKIYSGIVIAWGLFFVMGALTIFTTIYPDSSTKGVLQMVIATELLMAAVFLCTAVLNLRANALSPTNTTVQIAFLFLSIYGIPFAIWGIFLLRARFRQDEQRTEPT